jgi:serine/threonine protein kinase
MLDDHLATTAAIPVSSGMADLSGSVVAGRYRLAAPLGQGAMANVYRAIDDRLDRQVAVKLFHPGQDAAVRARFGAEALALARLSHPGLVGIFDAGVEGDRPYLVMQLVDGESLRDRLLSGPLDPDDVVLLGARLATALAHVHGNGIVHRDIKPSNIVLDHNGSPHLADFGIALLLDAARMTGSNEIMGTAAYLSPEQILGSDVGAAADVYSLGLVLLECLTGELEYPGVSKVESALARLHRSPKVPDGISPVLGELLSAMTAREPVDRPAAGDCAALFWAVREHRGMSGRAARTAAATWLARRGRQFGRSRTRSPLFSGWRRFAIAGSGLAMAILASTWLFTSLLPKVLPESPSIGGGVPQPHTSTGTGGGGTSPDADVRQNGNALHVAAAMTSGSHSGTTQPGGTGTTGASVGLVITSTLFGPSLPDTLGSGESSVVLQDSSVTNGPNSSPDTATDTPDTGGSEDPSTDTTDNGTNETTGSASNTVGGSTENSSTENSSTDNGSTGNSSTENSSPNSNSTNVTGAGFRSGTSHGQNGRRLGVAYVRN